MNIYKPLRIVLFFYEILRFTMFAIQGNVVFTIQIWQWTAPNALFLLMALFLLIDLDRYAVFLPLSVAGKSIAAVLAIWSIFSDLTRASMDMPFFAAVMAMGDIFSIFAYMYIMKGIRRQGEGNHENSPHSDALSRGNSIETTKTPQVEINKLKEEMENEDNPHSER
ncbi:MAG: hypothetical protein LBH75_03710 [Treponema sp.]|jgi:hypothetical protein|nr:hypothetical protein [Treponema sp.]